jgi:crossover junction endodeoxyribonuclease RuvC
MILCLDLGTHTGWAFGDESTTQSGIQAFPKPARGYTEDGKRYLAFRAWLQNFKTRHNALQAIYYEDVCRHNGTTAAHVYGGLRAILLAFGEQYQIRCTGIGVGVIKRQATSKGNAGKQEMLAWARANGYSPANDDEADALALLSYVRKKDFGAFDPGTELPLGEAVVTVGNPF